jgi:hypothetical protein
VAIDAGVDQLLARHSVEPAEVRDLVYGTIFTRAPHELHNTAIFVGGSNVAAGEALLEQVKNTFFGPMRVSVMFDANGSNTTAAAAVLAAARHVPLSGAEAAVLAATGPVGQRVVRLLAGQGAKVRVCSRNLDRAQSACEAIRGVVENASLQAVQTATPADTAAAVEGAMIVIAAGAAGVELVSENQRRQCGSLKVAIDLNAVPPLGIGGVKAADKAKERDGQICYGAIGVGGAKMKIHKAALKTLFQGNDFVLDAEEIFNIAQAVVD